MTRSLSPSISAFILPAILRILSLLLYLLRKLLKQLSYHVKDNLCNMLNAASITITMACWKMSQTHLFIAFINDNYNKKIITSIRAK